MKDRSIVSVDMHMIEAEVFRIECHADLLGVTPFPQLILMAVIKESRL